MTRTTTLKYTKQNWCPIKWATLELKITSQLLHRAKFILGSEFFGRKADEETAVKIKLNTEEDAIVDRDYTFTRAIFSLFQIVASGTPESSLGWDGPSPQPLV